MVLATSLLIGLAFAGSPSVIPAGAQVASVNVGGLTAVDARRLLARKARSLEDVPVVFTVAGRRFEIAPSATGVRVDWRGAVDAVRRHGDGFGPIRGFRRLGVRFFGVQVSPPVPAYSSAVGYELSLIAAKIDRPHREPAIRLEGLAPVVVPGQSGRVLDRRAAAPLLVAALASFDRSPVALPLRVDPPRVTVASLLPTAARVRLALSAPVTMTFEGGSFRITPRLTARLLELPGSGTRSLAIGGRAADSYFARLAKAVARPARDATFTLDPAGLPQVVPGQDGLTLDRAATEKALLAAALRPSHRSARIAAVATPPARTTADATAMGITGVVGSYETIYGGIANRIHNVQLVAHLIDGHLIAPGQEFSFNRTTGERTAAKGFLEAPVIINGELQTALGGGVCQVSTTVFNAAYETGLPITARTNHALYISHYPLARDATVNYPDTDLRFVNNSGHWLWLRTFVGSSSLTVRLYGTPLNRRVESVATPLVASGQPPVKEVKDPTLTTGDIRIDKVGSPPRSTSVTRRVYDEKGKLLYENTWNSHYQGEATVLRVGTKKFKLAPSGKLSSGRAG